MNLDAVRKEAPHVAEVCELFDCTVMTGPNLFWIGWQSDLAAGIRGGDLTPSFTQLRFLEGFCKHHIERFRTEATKF